MNPDQTVPKRLLHWEDGNSLISVYNICNIGYLRTYAYEKTDEKSNDWPKRAKKESRANSGSEFVVANTLAKWRKL